MGTVPPADATKTHIDQGTDDPKLARVELATLVDTVNALKAALGVVARYNLVPNAGLKVDTKPVGTPDELRVFGDTIGVIADGSTTARDLSERFAEIVNVKDHGAEGDGVTDDTAAVQDAADAAAGKGLFFPSGDYFFTQVSLPNNVRVFGQGYTSTLKTTSNNFMFVVKNKTDVHIDHLRFLGDLAAGTNQQAVSLEGAVRCSVTDCILENLDGRAIRLAFDFDNLVATENAIISRNLIKNIGDIGIFLKNDVRDVVISDNIIIGVGSGGTTDFAIGIVVDDGSSSDAGNAVPCKRILIANNIIREIRGDSTSRGLNITGCQDVLVFGNLLDDIGASGAAGMPGIRLAQGGLTPDNDNDRIVLVANTLRNIASDAIIVERSIDCYIGYNFISNWGANHAASGNRSAIQLTANVDKSSVVFNHMIAGSGADFGINIPSLTDDENIVYGNVINKNGQTFTAFQDTGTNTITSVGGDGQFTIT